MTEGPTVAAVLLVVGPIVGAIAASNPVLYPVWAAPREKQLTLVGAHRRAWTFTNVGFTIATLITAAGLFVLAGTVAADDRYRASLAAVAVVYAIAGALWCAVLAIRTRTTPALADMVATGTPTEPAETMFGAALGALFGAFTLATGGALIALGLTLVVSGVVAAPVAWLATLIAAVVIVGYLSSGDAIPLILYLPTLLVGIALLLGWS
jgi:hypothetical protein